MRYRRALSSLLFLCACASGAREERPSAPQAARVVAFADVHGAFEELTGLLRAAGIVDPQLRWSAGTAHVVSLGDLLDRGAGSRDAMDLLMRLQGEAAAAGGALHLVLGNHEAMNLMGDLRDTTPAELEAYGGKPGHDQAFAPEGKYGRWLLAQPVAILLGDTLFMHGGPSRLVAGLSLEEINRRYRSALSGYLNALGELVAAGLLKPDDAMEERAALAQKRLAAANDREQRARADTVRRFVAADRDPMLDAEGPNWYRGAALCNQASEADVLGPILERLGVRRLVVGHTVARGQRVASRFDGAVIKLDAGMNRAVFHGHPAALLLEGGNARVLYADEAGPPAPVPAEPLYVGLPIPDDDVATTLAGGTVSVSSPRDSGALDVMVDRVPAVFIPATPDAVKKERAAYRIDRALRLGLVPATVERDVQGRHGILQARPARWITHAEKMSRSLDPQGWCALGPQHGLMLLFDALIGMGERPADRALYALPDWMLLLTGHDRAFGTSRALPADAPRPGPEMRRRLARLDAAGLARAAGDLLTDDERAALLARRDALLR